MPQQQMTEAEGFVEQRRAKETKPMTTPDHKTENGTIIDYKTTPQHTPGPWIGSEQHEFSKGDFGPTTTDLCRHRHCGLREAAQPHKLYQDFRAGRINHIPLDLRGSEYEANQ